MPKFPQGAPLGAPVRVCDGCPCVSVVRDSVRGYVEWCPQLCYSGANQGLRLDLFCTFKQVWQCGAHNDSMIDGPWFRVGGVIRLVS